VTKTFRRSVNYGSGGPDIAGGQLAANDCVYSLAGATMQQQHQQLTADIICRYLDNDATTRKKDDSPGSRESHQAAAVTSALRLSAPRRAAHL